MKKENPDHTHVEKQLIPRLKAIGYILFAFSIITLGYRFTLPSQPQSDIEFFDDEEAAAGFSFLDDDEEEALLPTNPKMYYTFASVFATVGMLCITIARRKKINLAKEEE